MVYNLCAVWIKQIYFKYKNVTWKAMKLFMILKRFENLFCICHEPVLPWNFRFNRWILFLTFPVFFYCVFKLKIFSIAFFETKKVDCIWKPKKKIIIFFVFLLINYTIYFNFLKLLRIPNKVRLYSLYDYLGKPIFLQKI